MANFPFVSILLLGDHSIEKIDQSLNSLSALNYPKDQLEYYLLLPYHRPLSTFAKRFPKLRIIRFDETLFWTRTEAVCEGLSFATGDYIQISEATSCFHPDWLKTGLQYLTNQDLVLVKSSSRKHEDMSSTLDQHSIIDGLYNGHSLKRVVDVKRNELRNPERLKQKVLSIAAPMTIPGTGKAGQPGQQLFIKNRLRTIFSKYVLVK